MLIAGYEGRLKDIATVRFIERERTQLSLELKRLAVQEDRVTGANVDEVMELDRYKYEMEKLRKQRSGLGGLEDRLKWRLK